MSTASDPAVCGAGSVTDSIDVVVALDCWTSFAVGLQLLLLYVVVVCPLGVLDKVCLVDIHAYMYGYVYVL